VPPVVAGGAASGAGGAADSVTAGCSLGASCFWQLETNIRSPNTRTTIHTHKEPFFIFIISYPFFISADFYSAGGITSFIMRDIPRYVPSNPWYRDSSLAHFHRRMAAGESGLPVFRYYRVFVCHVNSHERVWVRIRCIHQHQHICICRCCLNHWCRHCSEVRPHT
jgi:hypothetical protein